MPKSPFSKLQGKTVDEYLDKFPDCASLTLARVIFKDNPALFINIDHVRAMIRYRRGAYGLLKWNQLKNKKYAKYRI